ncbi:hypothetical protein [Clostridium intestinale]|nr:hypothetical protein [Clostridium intestinale]
MIIKTKLILLGQIRGPSKGTSDMMSKKRYMKKYKRPMIKYDKREVHHI